MKYIASGVNYAQKKFYNIGHRSNSKRHGFGILKFGQNYSTNASSYEGYFENDRFSGNGTLVYNDGAIYVGDFLGNERHRIRNTSFIFYHLTN